MNIEEAREVFAALLRQQSVVPDDGLGRALALWPSTPAFALLKAVEAFHLADVLGAGSICDVGCGDGRFAKLMANKIDLGVDIDEGKLAAASATDVYRALVAADISCTDNSDLTQYGERFSSVISISTLEHIENPAAAVRNMARLAGREGQVILVVPTANKSKGLFYAEYLRCMGRNGAAQRYVDTFVEVYGHRSVLSVETYCDLIRQLGYDVEHVRYFEALPTSHCVDVLDRERFHLLLSPDPRSPLYKPLWELSRRLLYDFLNGFYIAEQSIRHSLDDCSECLIVARRRG